jgi:GATA-binding protein
VLCNACGLFLKLHGRPRPISLKTDVIKSRNRVKTQPATRKRDSQGEILAALTPAQAGAEYPATHSNVPRPNHVPPPFPSHHTPTAGERIPSPPSLSRAGTPNQHNPNIAPQHIFDTVSLPSDPFHSPSLPAFNPRQPSPSLNGHSLEPPVTYDALVAQRDTLRTRVSELEVINGLFRGRVTELEGAEAAARRAEREAREELYALRAEMMALQSKNTAVIRDTATKAGANDEQRQAKRARVEDEVAEGEATFAEFTNAGNE